MFERGELMRAVSEPGPLSGLAPGHNGIVRSVEGRDDFRRRLAHLGFLPGTRVHLVRRAPLGGPIEVRIRGYHLALRRRDARHVLIEHAVDAHRS
jgi:Fe2+ transport system protein FeoA